MTGEITEDTAGKITGEKDEEAGIITAMAAGIGPGCLDLGLRLPR